MKKDQLLLDMTEIDNVRPEDALIELGLTSKWAGGVADEASESAASD